LASFGHFVTTSGNHYADPTTGTTYRCPVQPAGADCFGNEGEPWAIATPSRWIGPCVHGDDGDRLALYSDSTQDNVVTICSRTLDKGNGGTIDLGDALKGVDDTTTRETLVEAVPGAVVVDVYVMADTSDEPHRVIGLR
jgi:hypothetical protein